MSIPINQLALEVASETIGAAVIGSFIDSVFPSATVTPATFVMGTIETLAQLAVTFIIHSAQKDFLVRRNIIGGQSVAGDLPFLLATIASQPKLMRKIHGIGSSASAFFTNFFVSVTGPLQRAPNADSLRGVEIQSDSNKAVDYPAATNEDPITLQ